LFGEVKSKKLKAKNKHEAQVKSKRLKAKDKGIFGVYF